MLNRHELSSQREYADSEGGWQSPYRRPRRVGRVSQLQEQVERLLDRLKLAVIFGGDKNVEGAVINQTINPRSWKSYEVVAQDIAKSLTRLGCHDVELFPEDMRLGERLRHAGTNMAWLNTGGVQGYNPMAHGAAMLEMFGIPYVGHDPLTAGILDNKHVFKQTLRAWGIPTAPFMTWHLARGPFLPKESEHFRRVFKNDSGPFIVKPVSGRASLHVHLVNDVAELTDAVAEVYVATENHVLIESFLPGREYCIAVCGPVTARNRELTRLREPFVFAAVERVLEEDEKIFTSMDVRPITTSRVRPLDAVADAEEVDELEKLARRVFHDLNLETLVRLDVRQDANGNMCVLEANPKPDLKAPSNGKTSLICAALETYGMSYDDLVLSLLADRIDRLFAHRRGTTARYLASLLG